MDASANPNRRQQRRPAEMAAEIAVALIKGPRRISALCEMVGVDLRRSIGVRKYVDEFRASGLVYIQEWTRLNTPVYAWQGEPYSKQDAPKPANDPQCDSASGRGRKPRVVQEYMGKQVTVRELAEFAGCSPATMYQRLWRGMDAHAAVAMGKGGK